MAFKKKMTKEKLEAEDNTIKERYDSSGCLSCW